MKKTLLISTLCISVLFSHSALAQIRVGLILPKSGVFAALGKDIDDGFNFAIKQAGREDAFTIVREDTEIKPPVGLSKTRKLVFEDEVDVLVGVVSSGVLGAMRDFVHQSQVPLIVSNAGNNHATGEQCSPYIVRVSFSNGQLNRPMGQWLYDQGIRKVYTLAPDYAAGHQQIGGFIETFTAAGGIIINSEFTPFRSTKDFSPYLTNVQASGADALYAFYAGGEAINFTKQYDSFDMQQSTPLFGPGSLNSPLYVDSIGDAALGIKTSLHYVPTLQNAENKAFVAAFTAEYDRAPSEYTVQGYDSAQLLMGAIDQGADNRASIATALPKVQYSGPRGSLQIDPRTNNVVQNIYIYETVKSDSGYSQKMLATAPNVQDPINGCKL